MARRQSLAEPFADGVRKAATQAIQIVFDESLMPKIRENLTGRVLNRRSGQSLANVEKNSRKTRDGFSVGTTAPNLIAFEKGSPRKAYFVRPVKAKALRWISKGGETLFSRGHLIPAWRFPRRSWQLDALIRVRESGGVIRALERSLSARLKEAFRGGKLTVRIGELNRVRAGATRL